MSIVYKKRDFSFWFLLGTGVAILLPVTILAIAAMFGGASDASGPAIVIGIITLPPALMLLFMASAMARLRIEIDDSGGRLKARLLRSVVLLFPWQVKDVEVPLPSIEETDIKQRANPYVPGGVETLYFLRTRQGNLFFHSQWFVDHAEIARRVTESAGVPTVHEDLDSPPIVSPGEPPRRLLFSEIAMRSIGYALFAASAIMLLFALVTITFTRPKDPLGIVKAIVVLTLALPASRWMTRFRAAR